MTQLAGARFFLQTWRSRSALARVLLDPCHLMIQGNQGSSQVPAAQTYVLAFGWSGREQDIERLHLGNRVRVDHVADLLPARIELRRGQVDLLLLRYDEDATDLERVLKSAQIDAPQVVRIVVCDDDVNRKELLRWLPFAHQVLALGSPGCAAAMHGVLRVLGLMTHGPTRELIGQNNRLPAQPKVYAELQEALRDPAATNLKLAEVIERDIGLSARLVQLVSSAFFGLPRQISSLGGCIAYLGHTTVVNLVLAAEVEQAFGVGSIDGFSSDSLQRQALLAARVAKRVAAHTGFEEEAFIAALFHSVGQLVLASRAPERFARALRLHHTTGVSLSQAEREIFGCDHAQVGAYLLGIWGVSLSVVEAVLYHETPQRLDTDALSIAGAVYIGRVLAEESGAELRVQAPEDSGPWLDAGYLERVGMTGSVSQWRAWARGA